VSTPPATAEVIVNGDSRFLNIDKPLTDAAGTTIQNVTRVQTFTLRIESVDGHLRREPA
jgi:hypothetical protein